MTDPTLSREQLQQITGYEQPKRMCAWLDAHGWLYIAPTRRGEIPKVGRAYADARLAGQTPDRPRERRAGPRIDFMLQPQ